MSVRTRIVKRLRERGWTWRWVVNGAPSLVHAIRPRPLPRGPAQRVLADLDRDGIAVTDVASLLGGTGMLEALQAVAREARSEDRIREADRVRSEGSFSKVFIDELVPDGQARPGDALWRLADDPTVRAIADAYLGTRARLRCCNIIRNVPIPEAAFASQLWHRDRDDYLMLKVFLYLEDVTEGSGPFVYALRSHAKAPRVPTPPHSLEGHVERSTDAQFETVVPRERWFPVVGPAGTLVFADTRGYHRGGHCTTDERIVYRAMYTSMGSIPFLRGAEKREGIEG